MAEGVTMPELDIATLPPDHGHAAQATVTPAAAARALRVRRETVHRWIKAGKLDVVVERNAQGRAVRRVPVVAIEALIRDGARDDAITLPDHAAAVMSPDHGHAASIEFVERLQLVTQTASTALAQLELVRAQVLSAVARLDEPSHGPWWRRSRDARNREAAASEALRQLAALPPVPEMP